MDDLKKVIFQKDDRFLIFEIDKPIKEMIGGKLIVCRICGKEEAVNKNSFCDIRKLCINHARKRLKKNV